MKSARGKSAPDALGFRRPCAAPAAAVPLAAAAVLAAAAASAASTAAAASAASCSSDASTPYAIASSLLQRWQG